jgi:DSP-PTPase phosphatase fused to NAD+ Kinase
MGTLDDIENFFRGGSPVNVHGIAHAVEDVPADAQKEAAMILSTPAGIAFQQRAFDVLENAVAALYGHAECADLLKFMSQYPVTAYTYKISDRIYRGERPDGGKITRLYNSGIRATINLCAETPDGDTPYVTQAGLTGKMETYHVPVVDATTPTPEQVVQLLAILEDCSARGVSAYIHCEAGKGRTGVMVACVRMATMGWSVKDAVQEATNFGMWTPDQQAFIEDFGARLVAQFDARAQGAPLPYPQLGGYPSQRPGSVTPTPQQLAMTIDKAAQGTGLGL